MGNTTSRNSSTTSSKTGIFESEHSDESHSTPPLKSLHGHLMNVHKQQDPSEFYETLEVLGEGSMGSVCRVKKRSAVIGGSARPSFVRHRRSKKRKHGFCEFHQPCFLFCPIRMNSERDHSHDLLQILPHDKKRIKQKLTNGQQPQKQQQASKNSSSNNNNNNPSNNDYNNSLRTHNSSTSSSSMLYRNQQYHQSHHRQDQQPQEDEQKLDHTMSNGNTNGTTTAADAATIRSRGSGRVGSIRRIKRPSSQAKNELDISRKSAPRHLHSKLITHGHKDVIYALKTIHLDRVSSADFMSELENEVSILKDLDHPNIVKAIETYNHKNQLFIVLELCSGGDLYTRDPYTEAQAAKIVKDMFSAISYMHSRKITHRDLKYENIMFTSKDEHADIKLIDFGLSKKYAANQYLHDTVGTVYTMAPELLGGNYTSSVDVWSMGVIAFMLLSSSMPFFGRDRKHVMRKIVKGKYHFASRRWSSISKEAKAFIAYLLQRDPKYRPTAENALSHSWLKMNEVDDEYSVQTKDLADGEEHPLDEVQATIQSFADYGILKKLALMIVAYKSTDEEIGVLRQIFNKYDGLKDGEVSLAEFKAALDEYLYSDEELERIFSGMDMDGTGVVHYSEFLAATIESHGSIDEERLAEAFDRLDTDDSGYITVDDLKDFLGNDIPIAHLNGIIDAVDLDHDHRISYEEFLAMWDHTVDDKRKKAKAEVHERRMRRADSKQSLTSMDSGMSSTDDEFAGSFDFMRQKAKSVRSMRKSVMVD